ncbi:hypothetical protein F4703DRAFT_1105708 [Phycomyces blakesleeanus]
MPSVDHNYNVHRITKRVRSVRIPVDPKVEAAFQEFLRESSKQYNISKKIEQEEGGENYIQSPGSTSTALIDDSTSSSQLSGIDKALNLPEIDKIQCISNEAQQTEESQATREVLPVSQSPYNSNDQAASSQVDLYIHQPSGRDSHSISDPVSDCPKTFVRTFSELSQDPSFKEYKYNYPPPLISASINAVYQEPFYSNPEDVPIRPKIFSGKEFKLSSKSIQHLKEFDPLANTSTCFLNTTNTMDWRQSNITSWSPSIQPPSLCEVETWLKQRNLAKSANKDTYRAKETQAEDSLNESSALFKAVVTKPKTKRIQERDHVNLFSLEIHVNSRGKLLPNPTEDEVNIVFWALQTDNGAATTDNLQSNYVTGIITVDPTPVSKIGINDMEVDYVENELSIFCTLIDKIRMYDPDILVGYELNNSSWGYLIERAAANGNYICLSL